MESFGTQSSEGISVKEIERMMEDGRSENARGIIEQQLLKLRAAVADIQDAIEKNDGEIETSEWREDFFALQQEVDQLVELQKRFPDDSTAQ